MARPIHGGQARAECQHRHGDNGTDPAGGRENLPVRSVRELLLNVVKHSNTLFAKVHLKEDDRKSRVVVSDSGAGYDVCALQRGAVTEGFGLFSIRDGSGLWAAASK